jgi:hypothetical protein
MSAELAAAAVTAAPSELEPSRRVLLATCGYCWAASGEHCTGGPGSHLARWIRAERKGLIIGAELAAALEKLDDIAASVKVGTV